MLFAAVVLVYVPGLLWFGYLVESGKRDAYLPPFGYQPGAIPFIAGDILKAGFAAAVP